SWVRQEETGGGQPEWEVTRMCEGLDRAAHVARLYRLRGATDAYCTELERALPVARCLYGAGDEGAGRLVDSMGAALDGAALSMGSPKELRCALRDLLDQEKRSEP